MESTACSSNSVISSDWRHSFVPGTGQCRLEFSSVVEYSSYDSLVWHTRVFYLVVLIEHIVDWNIQTRLSGERPRIHGVRLSVAYSIQTLDRGGVASIEAEEAAASSVFSNLMKNLS